MAKWISQSAPNWGVSRRTGIDSTSFEHYLADREAVAYNAKWILSILEESDLSLTYPDSGFSRLSANIGGVTDPGEMRPQAIVERIRTGMAPFVTIPAYPWPADYPDFDGSVADKAKTLWNGDHFDQWMRAVGNMYTDSVSRNPLDIDAGVYRIATGPGAGEYHSGISAVGRGISGATSIVYQGYYIFDDTVPFSTTNQKWVLMIACEPLAGYDNPGDAGAVFAITGLRDVRALKDDPEDMWDAFEATWTTGYIYTYDDLQNGILFDMTPVIEAAIAVNGLPAIKVHPLAYADNGISDILDISAWAWWTFFTDATTPAGYPS